MDPEEQREISRKGGRASHGEDEGEEERHGNGRRGFAAMDPAEQREIASRGGRAAHGEYSGEEEDDEDGGGRKTRGGTSEQHAKAGRQSHKNR
jgi:general stress protein YciG